MPGLKKRSRSAAKAWGARKKIAASPTSNRPSKLKQWSDESMVEAIEAVRSGKMGTNEAARAHNVPPSTLKDRLSGRVRHGSKPGPSPYLSAKAELELKDFLVRCSELGCGKTKREVISIVKRTVQKKGTKVDHFNGEGWWLRFMQRHPKLSLRCSDPLSRMRANAVTEENIAQYFSLLEETLKKNGLFNKPSRIYNMDETGMPLDHKQLKRVALKGVKKVHSPASGDKSQITVVACANAAGHVLPPMVIFKGEKFNHEWSVDEIPDTLYGMSENGWIDMGLFNQWFEKIFLKHIPPQRPAMLLCDGHGSHFTPDAISRAAEEGDIILCIPPNTTHKAQPLDVSFFAPLKRYWSSTCHSYTADNPGCVVTKLNFSRLLSQTWFKSIKPETIVNGFRKCGVCPFNVTAIEIPSTPNSGSQSPVSNASSPLNTPMTRLLLSPPSPFQLIS